MGQGGSAMSRPALSVNASEDVRELYSRYLRVLDHERRQICREYPPGSKRDRILACYVPVPFECFEARMIVGSKLVSYVSALERAEFMMTIPDCLE
jgi:hypothetical protein